MSGFNPPRPLYNLWRRQRKNYFFFIPIHLWRWNRQSVPKRRHIKCRRRGITQKKAYNTLPLFFTLQTAIIRFRYSVTSHFALLHTVDSGLAIGRSLFKKYYKIFEGCVITSNYKSEQAWTAFGSKVRCTSGGHLFLDWLRLDYVAHETAIVTHRYNFTRGTENFTHH